MSTTLQIDPVIQTTEQLYDAISRIHIKPSGVDFDWTFEVEEIYTREGKLRGWMVNTTFRRPDSDTGTMGIGRGRQELISVGTYFSGTIKTCWLLIKLIVEHELLEAFCVQASDGVVRRVFDPHASVENLCRAGRTDEAVARQVPVIARKISG